MVKTTTELISTGCNRTAHSLDRLDDTAIAFGAGNYVALYRPSTESAGIERTLQGHTGRVNCVRFGRTETGTTQAVLVSGSADCTARVWIRRTTGWQCTAVLEGHTKPVVAVASLCTDTGVVIVTTGTDGTVRVYEHGRDGGEDAAARVQPVQTIDVGARNALAATLAALPGDGGLVLATGNTDNRIHLYTRSQKAGAEFAAALVLDGHDDWVTDVAFTTFSPSTDDWKRNGAIAHWRSSDVVLASASQDKYVRLWRIRAVAQQQDTGDRSAAQALVAAQAMLDALTASVRAGTGIEGAAQLSTREHVMQTDGAAHAVALDSVLLGHDGWVHSVEWTQTADAPALVTASGDSSVMVWAPDSDGGVWASVARLGEVGGAVAGFLGASADPSGRAICAHSYHGSLHSWTAQRDSAAWVPEPSPSGHFGAVVDVSWDPRGAYVLSASLDQTARLHAPWHGGWREIARPQIHGYDLRCAAFVSPFRYVSGADEKVVRVFQATQQFAAAWRALSADPTPQSVEDEAKALPVGAALPVLGLSNKAVEEAQVLALADDSARPNDTYHVRQTHTDVVASAALDRARAARHGPPMEEDLLRHTLWPEVDKLYGHPYEIFAVAASHAGDWVATACRATAERYASVRLYSTATWQPPALPASGGPAPPLAAHALTITRLRFSPPAEPASPADAYLLSVSRDRSWALYARQSGPDPYRLARRQQKAHMRIIWDAAWSPDARFFATASRDKTVKLWPLETDAKPVALAFPEPVTAVDFLPALVADPSGARLYVLAAALESGRVFVLVGSPAADADASVPTVWTPAELPRSETHTAMVHRLAWRPRPDRGALTAERLWHLASASADQTVRIMAVEL
ncbi:Elongator subunit elp2 [Coemansia sp. RSA 1933]|nr:Elongator subunit elp2 [Coemansia sp. RSA 1933]